MSLIPDKHFWFFHEDNLRVGRTKRIVGDSVILTVFRNDDDAWSNKPLADSYFFKLSEITFLEGLPDCLSCFDLECPEDTCDLSQSGSILCH